ncbi:hypothetical protein HT031_003950 [Scenedesmus sp. PABB004]|nr:hypothetical protein HT031_003950 [Scenedesmus sp. PABB004]
MREAPVQPASQAEGAPLGPQEPLELLRPPRAPRPREQALDEALDGDPVTKRQHADGPRPAAKPPDLGGRVGAAELGAGGGPLHSPFPRPWRQPGRGDGMDWAQVVDGATAAPEGGAAAGVLVGPEVAMDGGAGA